MFLSVVSISLFLIGSSMANLEEEKTRLLSLHLIFVHIDNYVKDAVLLIDKLNELESSTNYTTYAAQENKIVDLVKEIDSNISNLDNSQVPQTAIQAAQDVIQEWKPVANNVIDYCINVITGTDKKNDFLELTINEMSSIHNNPMIINELKREGSPIYAKLYSIVSSYGTEDQKRDFQSNYGPQ